MTNREKFVEVFGEELHRQNITKSWWEQEYIPPHLEVEIPSNGCLCMSCKKIITNGKIFPLKVNPNKGLCFKCY